MIKRENNVFHIQCDLLNESSDDLDILSRIHFNILI